VTTQLERSAQVAADRPPETPPNRRSTASSIALGLAGCAAALVLIYVAHNARRGAVDPRISNPAVHGAPRPVRPLFGWTHWLGFLQVNTIIALTLIVVLFVVLCTVVMIPAGVLLYRDDTGKTVAEKLAQRVRAFRGRPALGTFLVMAVILNACYFFLYGGGFAIIRDTGVATSVACPWPYPEAKVYDPQGLYEKAGASGPYAVGIWAGWETAQSGRPHVSPPANGGRCSSTLHG
jgi:hypothetical protein